MANRILTGEGWQNRIRSKLGVFEAYLPNSDIELPENITLAEANIIEQVPDYESLEGDQRVYLEASVVCECARIICSSLPSRLPVKENGPHEGHEINVDWSKTANDLRNERDEYIGKIHPAKSFHSIPHFVITNPRRLKE